jgi:hypothetical protein
MTRHLNPLALVACKQRVGKEDANAVALPLMCHFDAAHRGQCTGSGANHLTTHLIIASYIAAATKSKAFHDLVTKAYAMLRKAAARPTKLLDLTTAEYAALKQAFAWYLRALPQIEVGLLAQACAAAEKAMA